MLLNDYTETGIVGFGDLEPTTEYFVSTRNGCVVKLYCLLEGDQMEGMNFNAFCITDRKLVYIHAGEHVAPIEISTIAFAKICKS